ncbi:glycoside hydrolase family 3 N-terminal domain-containing protein [Virgisporangium aurantiacum]|uniref:Beta-glucosidase n=1 Tax=Virgisporangium aurantiacum TaxID=175570 RepID=A0A8J3YYU5_9ACTN|nr:glycoside hydrolase family 3 N-terminal domain-containing protein [Virgisporangium aurantiacum]GIJ54194.1 beta-glucosidase [Virgisporangium aurantiacum]
MAEVFQDPTRPVGERVDDLLPRLTLREKVGQLNQRLFGWTAWRRTGGRIATTDALDEEAERWGGLGAVYGLLRADAWSGRDWTNGADPHLSREVAATVQERVVTASRFGIPALFVEEAPHGHQALGSQLFPTSLGAAAAWRPDLVERAAAHVAREVRARGAHVAMVSALDVLRDPRWGRSEECFGEDPLLAALCTRALVRGMHTEPGIAVVLKHLIGQGAAIGGRNSSGAPIGPRELSEVHLAAARAGVDAGALGVMAAYNDIDGVPCVAHERLLTGVLRDEWGFEGIVMADMFAVDRLMRVTESPAAAAALALRAGVDLSLCDVSYTALERAVTDGLVAESYVDRACRRVLALKVRLGLLDEPAPLPAFPPPDPVSELVASTAVLLRNRGDLLPLTVRPRRVAVIGPNADDVRCLLGDYVPPLPPGAGTTVFEAVRAIVGDAVTTPGCTHLDAIDGGRERAADLAADADLVVLVLGGTGVRDYDDDFEANGAARLGGARPAATTGEGFDAAEVELPPAQRELADAVVAAGTPVVAVIVSGRPHGIGHVADVCDAVIYAWYPGPAGAEAIAGLLLGDREPVGRLPVSLPRSSAVLPVVYNERLETTLRYVDAHAAAEFPFGAGIGYTTWSVGPARASHDTVTTAALPGLSLTTTLANTGPRRGTQIVQLYARALIPGLLPRRAVHCGFTRVTLDAGAAETVRVEVEPDALPALGLDARSAGTLDFWLSVTGAGEPVDPVRVTLLAVHPDVVDVVAVGR